MWGKNIHFIFRLLLNKYEKLSLAFTATLYEVMKWEIKKIEALVYFSV